MPSLRSLDPRLRPSAEAFFRWARAQTPGLVVTSARRTRAEQQRLYDRFLAGQNDGLPAIPPGHSDHEAGLAWDMARLNHRAVSDPALPVLGAAWARLGGRWWAGDPVHFAWAPGLHGSAPGRRSRRTPRRRRTTRGR